MLIVCDVYAAYFALYVFVLQPHSAAHSVFWLRVGVSNVYKNMPYVKFPQVIVTNVTWSGG